jgi:hypothetical protein
LERSEAAGARDVPVQHEIHAAVAPEREGRWGKAERWDGLEVWKGVGEGVWLTHRLHTPSKRMIGRLSDAKYSLPKPTRSEVVGIVEAEATHTRVCRMGMIVDFIGDNGRAVRHRSEECDAHCRNPLLRSGCGGLAQSVVANTLFMVGLFQTMWRPI